MLASKLFWTGLLVLAYAAVATGGDYAVNNLFLHHPGGYTPVESTLLAVLIGAPTTFYFLGQRMDLRGAIAARAQSDATVRRKTEELAASEHRYRQLADLTPDIVTKVNLKNEIVYASPSVARYGYAPADLIGQHVSKVIHPDDLAARDASRILLLADAPDEAGRTFRYRVRTSSGDYRWFEATASVMRDDAGAPIGVASYFRDVDQRVRAEAQLAESEARYRLLADASPDVVVRTDESDRIVYVSPSVARFGYRAEDVVGQSATALAHPGDASARAPLAQRADGEPPSAAAGRYRAADGSYRWMETSSVLVDDPASGGKHTITYMRDVTAHVALESELRRKQAEAEAASQAKSEFLANMSHEIRTPLTGVVGFAGLLESMPELPAEARRYASRIATSAEALVTVVNDILDFSKLEAGQIELDPHAFDPAEMVASTSDLVRDRAARKGLALEVGLEGPPPPRLTAYSARLRQVLLNLLTNAVKFTETGSVSVTASYDPAAARLRVSVRDTGIGVPAELADRLFKRFSQVDASSSRAFGGTGLGLAISKSLVEMMGGTIGVDSRAGLGSTFWFEVPAATAPDDEVAPAESPADDAALGRLRLLLVDDVATNRELISTMLSPFDVDIVEADSGPEAVKAAMGARFDLILMDLQMPGMDGMAATRSILANSDSNRATPVVAISANVLPDQVADAKAAGMVDHIGKPIDPGELITKIARWTSEAAAPVPVA